MKYRVDCVFSPLDTGFSIHLERYFVCPFPCSDLDEYLADFIYGLISDSDD